MADLPESDYDAQDSAEVFDEDNTNLDEVEYSGKEDAEQAEDLVDVFNVTTADGDVDDDDGLEDDNLARRDGTQFEPERDLDDVADVGEEDPDDVDATDALAPGEVELEYAGDLNDLEGASSSAADLESDTLSDEDLRELDYQKG